MDPATTRVFKIFVSAPPTATQALSVRALRLLVLSLLVFSSACSETPEPSVIDLGAPATTAQIEAASGQADAGSRAFRFGFDVRNGPKEDIQQYLPLLDYLTNSTGFVFSLQFSESSEELVADLAAGKLQFAAIGAGTYLTAQRDAPIVPLVRGINASGEKGYRAVFVVAPDSPLRTVQELKGTRMAFGSVTSTQGHWIPRFMLERAGISLDDLASFVYTGSHRACAEAVISGRVDTCGMQDTLARHLIATGSVRELATSEIYPSSGIFSHDSVPASVRAAVSRALTDFDPQGRDRDELYHWERTEMAGGFVAASAEDYKPLRVQAKRLGLLPQAAVTGDQR